MWNERQPSLIGLFFWLKQAQFSIYCFFNASILQVYLKIIIGHSGASALEAVKKTGEKTLVRTSVEWQSNSGGKRSTRDERTILQQKQKLNNSSLNSTERLTSLVLMSSQVGHSFTNQPPWIRRLTIDGLRVQE